MCEHNGKTYQQKERYYTADCEKKCVCRKRGKFSCQPLCKKRTTPVCEYPFVKIVRVNGTNCTCAVVKCAKKPSMLLFEKKNSSSRINPLFCSHYPGFHYPGLLATEFIVESEEVTKINY